MGVVYAKFTARTGRGRGITRGDVWDADDPLVRAHPDWFTDDPSEFVHRSGVGASTVEAATAVPGEKRHLSKTSG